MRIAIVEDSAGDADLLYSQLCRYGQEHKVHLQLHIFHSEADFLTSVTPPPQIFPYDLVLMDIYLGRTSGLALAARIKELSKSCQIIFTTTSMDHAVKAFRLNALDYLVKPFSYAQLSDALNRYAQAARPFQHYIELKEERHQTRVLLSDILYTDYSNHYIQIHTPERVIRTYQSFDDFSPRLAPYPQFLWCYRNCIVNMEQVAQTEDRNFLLKNGERIPISRNRKNEILQAYADYLFDFVKRR